MFRWSEYQPITKPTSGHSLVRDVESHLTREQFRYYGNFGDVTTQIHECTHGIQANIRNSIQGHVNAFYVLENRYAWFNEPNFRKRDIIPHIPERWHEHHLFRTYISGAPAWKNEPLYVWDEGNSYCNGATAGESKSEIEFATIFGWFAFAVLKTCDERDREAGMALGPFFEWQLFRLGDIVQQHGTADHRRLYEQLTDHVRE